MLNVKELQSRYVYEKSRIERLEGTTVESINKPRISIGDTVEICNKYTRFSTWREVKAVKDTIKGSRNIANYDRDKFGIVFAIDTGTYGGRLFDKIHFTTDSGKDTWCKADYLTVHHEQRRVVAHSRQRKW